MRAHCGPSLTIHGFIGILAVSIVKEYRPKHVNNTLVLTALELALPGTVSIFYGDEIGLDGIGGVETDFHEHEVVNNVVSMSFSNEKDSAIILPWIAKSERKPSYHFLDVIKLFTKVRLDTPTIYLRSIYKEGNNLKNMEIRETEENLVCNRTLVSQEKHLCICRGI